MLTCGAEGRPSQPDTEVNSLLGSAIGGMKDRGVLDAQAADELTAQLNAQQRREMVWLWENRATIDVQNEGTQMQVVAGFAWSCLPRKQRQARFLDWMAGALSGDNFRQYVAATFLNDDGLPPEDIEFASALRDAYLKWHQNKCPEKPWDPALHLGQLDWGFATALAMLLAYKQAQPLPGQFAHEDPRYRDLAACTGRTLHNWRHEIPKVRLASGAYVAFPLTVFGAGASSLSSFEMPQHDHCRHHATPSLVLESEYHDKVGNWFGYLPMLALAWRHLLELPREAPNPFPAEAEITLPDTTVWPGADGIVVPGDVLAEAHYDPHHMVIPIRAIATAEPLPRAGVATPLFKNPPRQDIGRRNRHPA